VAELNDYSRQTIERGSKSFAAAARLLDRNTRESAHMLYAWCRYCDDQIDTQHLGFAIERETSSPRSRLQRLEQETRQTLAGDVVDRPAFVALRRVVERHDIPDRYPLELLQGFAMDVEGHRYNELDDTLLYCYHVAGVVGVMMAYVMGVSGRDTLQRAADLGIAFQLTNIARDVMDDARLGRVYLPSRWLGEAKIPPAQIAAAEHRSAVFAVVKRVLDEAERYYASAAQGLPRLGLRCAWSIDTARTVYRDIGRAVVERGPAAWNERVVVSGGRKMLGVLRGLLGALAARSAGRWLPGKPRTGLWTKPDQSEP
jgi:phytoene synthase